MIRIKFTKYESVALSEGEVREVVREKLPAWKTACDRRDIDAVVLAQQAFGNISEQLSLLAAAIKYAGLAGKRVTIIP